MKVRALLPLLAILALPVAAQADQVTSFHSDITLSRDNVVTVRETIQYDPQDNTHHGIFRFVPAQYSDSSGHRYYTRVSFNSVTDGNGTPYNLADWHANRTELYLKIGDPNQTISGPHTYIITYQIAPLVVAGNGFDRFIFNVTGEQWPTTIVSASATLKAPGAVTSLQCYTGIAGSQAQNCIATKTDTTATVAATQPLSAGEGLTLDVRLPSGGMSNYLQPDTPLPFSQTELTELAIISAVLLAWLLVLVRMAWRWYRDRRDQKAQTIVPQYEPPDGLKPIHMSLLESPRSDKADIAASLIDLAVRGHLKITQTRAKTWFRGADYSLSLLDSAEQLAPFEQELLTGLFAGSAITTLDEVKARRDTKLKDAVKRMREDAGNDLKQKGYYRNSPTSWIGKGRLIALAAAIGALGFAFSQIGNGDQSGVAPALAIGIAATLAAWVLMHFRTDRTQAGDQEWAKVEGFKWFLRVTEKDRLAFTDAPVKTPELFSKMLPYAIALKVEQEWAKQFDGIDVSQSVGGWYGGYTGAWVASSFVGDFSSGFSGAVGSSFAGASGAGGVGGGGGGGGGGGW